jgi:glycosyltransferase involved in cell wall biosynthesis
LSAQLDEVPTHRRAKPLVQASDVPSFSVVIPTYQRRELVCDAVRAMSAQEYDGSIEIVVIVDGSTDGTADALKKVDCAVPMKVIEQSNRGAAAARNRGAAEAFGDVVLFLDDDMIARPNLVEEHAKMYCDGAQAVIGDFPTDGWSPAGFLTDSLIKQEHWARVPGSLSPFDVFTGQLSVRRSVFAELGGFDEVNFTAGGSYGNEDLDFGVRLLDRVELQYNPNAICFQRSTVSPSQYMRRARSVAYADIRFALKHPKLANALFEHRGLGKFSWRIDLLSRVPGFPTIFGVVVVCLSSVALRTRFRSDRRIGFLFAAAYIVRYWSSIWAGGRRHPSLRRLPR